MNKDSAVELLRDNGYKAEIDSNVPMVYISTTISKLVVNNISNLLRDNGYLGSYGIKFNTDKQGGKNNE